MKLSRIIILALLFLLFIMGNVNASDDFGFNQTADTLSVDLNLTSSESNFEDNIIEESSNEVIVNDWEDLQYYCSLNDNDYTLKLKENTNYYPSDVSDSNGQIIVRNNVKIIGSEGAYVGDVSPQARNIGYAAIKVADDSGIGITLENVTFKWIGTNYQSDGVFLVMGGNANNYIKNCYFTNISTNIGHSSILHIKKVMQYYLIVLLLIVLLILVVLVFITLMMTLLSYALLHLWKLLTVTLKETMLELNLVVLITAAYLL